MKCHATIMFALILSYTDATVVFTAVASVISVKFHSMLCLYAVYIPGLIAYIHHANINLCTLTIGGWNTSTVISGTHSTNDGAY